MHTNRPDNETELLEVVDSQDRPVAALPRAEVLRQSLYHRAVLVLLYDRDRRLYLQRRARTKKLYPGRLDLSATGLVRAGESREDAAVRELREELGLVFAGLRRVGAAEASHLTAYAFVTLFTTGPTEAAPHPDAVETEGGFFVTRREAAYLVASHREQLTPGLVHFWERGLLFPEQATHQPAQ